MKILLRWFRWFRGHDWEYRNPFSRKCLRCGKRQDNYTDHSSSWWETMYPSAHSPELCGEETE